MVSEDVPRGSMINGQAFWLRVYWEFYPGFLSNCRHLKGVEEFDSVVGLFCAWPDAVGLLAPPHPLDQGLMSW